MRPTKLVAASTESFADAARRLIKKATSLSGNIKTLHILEDGPASTAKVASEKYRLRGHIIKRP